MHMLLHMHMSMHMCMHMCMHMSMHMHMCRGRLDRAGMPPFTLPGRGFPFFILEDDPHENQSAYLTINHPQNFPLCGPCVSRRLGIVKKMKKRNKYEV